MLHALPSYKYTYSVVRAAFPVAVDLLHFKDLIFKYHYIGGWNFNVSFFYISFLNLAYVYNISVKAL